MLCQSCKNNNIPVQIIPLSGSGYFFQCSECYGMCSCGCGLKVGLIISFARNYSKYGKTSILKLVKNAIKNGREVDGKLDFYYDFVKSHYPQHISDIEKYLVLL
jgi:hypothetical protein